MTKIIVKKNMKPQKKIKQKQKQTQKQNVTVNIGTNIIKKRGRPKKAQATKQTPTKQAPIIAPSFQSFNQPIFKPPISQPSSLASTMLATQEKPKVVAEEKKEQPRSGSWSLRDEQTTLQKALQEQNSNDPIETKENDLERVRNKRVEKLDKQEREALTSQVLSNQQDDTEEINFLSPPPKRQDIQYTTTQTQTPSFSSSEAVSRLPPIVSKRELRFLNQAALSRSYLDSQREELRNLLLGREQAEQPLSGSRSLQDEQPLTQEEESFAAPVEESFTAPNEVNPEVAAQQEEVLSKIKGRGAAKLITETPSEPTPLTQPTVELGFGGLSEESLQTSVGQFLPSAPVSQNELIVKESKKKGKSILKPIEPPPPITEEQETAPSILQDVRAADQYVTQQLVKDEPPGGAPLAEARVVESSEKIPAPLKQVETKWYELEKAGLITADRTYFNGNRKGKEDLLKDINAVSGYEKYKPIEGANKPGPSKKVATVVAQAVLGGTEL